MRHIKKGNDRRTIDKYLPIPQKEVESGKESREKDKELGREEDLTNAYLWDCFED